MGIKETTFEKLNQAMEGADPTTVDGVQILALGASAVKNLSESEGVDDSIYTIGTAGEIGFGVGAIRDWQVPSGYVKLVGHDNPLSSNYGNLTDMTGSVMVAIPKFYFKIETNNILISSELKAGYVLHRMFINAGKEIDYVLVDKYGCGNVGG